MPFHSLIPQVEFFRRPSKEDEPMVGKGWAKEFRGRQRSVAHRV
jgi:hypothetical protein